MKYHFDEAKAERAVKFFSGLTHIQGRWAGQPFKLLDWQDVLVREIYGWVDENGYRQFNTVYVEVPKKNGKTELASAIVLKSLVADDEMGAQVYSAAVNSEQSNLVYNPVRQMVLNNRVLRKRLKLIDSTKRIVDYETNSFYHVLSRDKYSKHGLNVHAAIIDELHAIQDGEFVNVLTYGSGLARTQPLIFIITTAGIYDVNSIGWKYHEKAMQVMQGIYGDEHFLPFIMGLDRDENWELEENWVKVNPALGNIFSIESLRSDYQKAKIDIDEQNNFRRYRLNQWIEQSQRLFEIRIWDECAGPVNLTSGRSCYLGMDLASTNDLTALVAIFVPDKYSNYYDILPYFFLPERAVEKRAQKGQVYIRNWAQQGLIKKTPGDATDYNFVVKQIEELADRFKVLEIAYDRWGSSVITGQLQERGFSVIPITQTFGGIGPPTKDFLKMVLERKVQHGGNPVLRWNASNVVVDTDCNGNIKPNKAKSKDSIDGIVAAILATDRVTRNEGAESVYEKRGPIII